MAKVGTTERLPVHSKGYHSTVPQCHRRLVWTRNVFASFSCAASGARSPSRPLSAGVASHLTPMATTEQRVRHQGCSDVGGFLWRVVPRAFAERLERGCPPTSGSRTSLLPGGQLDDRRLEVVADGLPLFHGAQLAIDTTLVSPVRADGAPRRQCATRNGVALDQARRTKERRYPELTGRVWSRTLGCPCLRDWRPMVGGGPRLLATPRLCQSKVGTTGDPRSGATLLVQTLVHSIVMLCGAGVRNVTVGAPWRFGC